MIQSLYFLSLITYNINGGNVVMVMLQTLTEIMFLAIVFVFVCSIVDYVEYKFLKKTWQNNKFDKKR